MATVAAEFPFTGIVAVIGAINGVVATYLVYRLRVLAVRHGQRLEGTTPTEGELWAQSGVQTIEPSKRTS